jgi:hypothetical protein
VTSGESLKPVTKSVDTHLIKKERAVEKLKYIIFRCEIIKTATNIIKSVKFKL